MPISKWGRSRSDRRLCSICGETYFRGWYSDHCLFSDAHAAALAARKAKR